MTPTSAAEARYATCTSWHAVMGRISKAQVSNKPAKHSHGGTPEVGLTKQTPAYVTLHKGQPARLCRGSPCRTASWGLDKDLTAIRVIGRPADQGSRGGQLGSHDRRGDLGTARRAPAARSAARLGRAGHGSRQLKSASPFFRGCPPPALRTGRSNGVVSCFGRWGTGLAQDQVSELALLPVGVGRAHALFDVEQGGQPTRVRRRSEVEFVRVSRDAHAIQFSSCSP